MQNVRNHKFPDAPEPWTETSFPVLFVRGARCRSKTQTQDMLLVHIAIDIDVLQQLDLIQRLVKKILRTESEYNSKPRPLKRLNL